MSALKYIGFDENTGYGVAADSLIKALQEASVSVYRVSVLPGKTEQNRLAVTRVNRGYQQVIMHVVPEYYPQWLEWEKAFNSHTRVWGYTAWETDTIPHHWPPILNGMDGIFVPCRWNAEVFRKGGITTKIEVLPHVSQFCGRPSGAKPGSGMRKIMELIKDKYVFYNIGVWNERKAPWLMIEAFLAEFRAHEPVALIVKTGKRDWTQECRKWWKPWKYQPCSSAKDFSKIMDKHSRGPLVIHADSEWRLDDIEWLHQRGDCYISLSRGEGWGLGAYEAAWWGKPLITTGYGGVLDYAPEEYSYHVSYKLIPVQTFFGGQSYTSEQLWADSSMEDARRLMRQVFEDRGKAYRKGQLLKEFVTDNFSAAKIATRCLEAIL